MEEDPFRGKVKPLKGREWKGVYRLFFLPRREERTVYIVSIRRRTERTYR